jgi:hypothetical protein
LCVVNRNKNLECVKMSWKFFHLLPSKCHLVAPKNIMKSCVWRQTGTWPHYRQCWRNCPTIWSCSVPVNYFMFCTLAKLRNCVRKVGHKQMAVCPHPPSVRKKSLNTFSFLLFYIIKWCMNEKCSLCKVVCLTICHQN